MVEYCEIFEIEFLKILDFRPRLKIHSKALISLILNLADSLPFGPCCQLSKGCEPILISIWQFLRSSTNHSVHIIVDIILNFFISTIFHFWWSKKWKIIRDDVIGQIELDIWNFLGIFLLFI